MSTDLVRQSVKWTREQVELIKRTVAAGSTDDELKLFMYCAKRTGLDPLIRQIYAIKRWDAESNGYKMTIQTGIEGYRLIAERTGERAGETKPVFVIDPSDPSIPYSAEVTVYRMKDGEKIPYTAEVLYKELVQKKKDGTPTRFWRDSPFQQLGKCAAAKAYRMAFPAEMAGLITSEEMGGVIDVTPHKETEHADQPADRTGYVPEKVYDGVLTAFQPGEGKKKPARVTVQADGLGAIALTTWETPIVKTDIGRACQFSYTEKANPKSGPPFLNLSHFALADQKPESNEESPSSIPPNGLTEDDALCADDAAWEAWCKETANSDDTGAAFTEAKRKRNVGRDVKVKDLPVKERLPFLNSYRDIQKAAP